MKGTPFPNNIKGREQAHSLFECFHGSIDKFHGIYSSDLKRAKDTAEIALGFIEKSRIKEEKRLRELYFGKDEGTFPILITRKTF